MRVLFAASEVHPFAKTGGLADVAAALPRALDEMGVEVAIVLPYYRQVRRRGFLTDVVAERVGCPFAGTNRPFRLLRAELPGAPGVPVYLVENPGIFEVEDQIYGSAPGSYGDGHLRFLYFARAALRVPRTVHFAPDVFHLNDWQTGLLAPLLRSVHRDDPMLSPAAVVMTIHNLAYQGVFPSEDLDHAGVPGYLVQEGRLLEDGLGNLLAGGLRFADAITTVSRTYAEEIMTPEYGNGLEGLLAWRRDLIRGIVNGLDVDHWNPETDPHLPARYTAADLAGKEVCRRRLLEECALDPTGGPVFGVVSRLVSQKGLDLVPPVFAELLTTRDDVRLVVLGSGETPIEDAFRDLERRHPGHVHVRIGFDTPFSSRVEAGADLFLMPSRFEPCGLNQLISMRYGTPPIVHRVGGLRDTVVDATEDAVVAGRATGFAFDGFHAGSFREALHRAIAAFRRPEVFDRIRRAGMERDWSWRHPAEEYVAVYREAMHRREDGAHLEPLVKDLPPEPLEIEMPLLAAVPEHYPRDAMVMIPVDPWTLYCGWELDGPRSRAVRHELSPEQHEGISYELVLADEDDGTRSGVPVGGLGRQWFATVKPGRRYRGEVYLHAPGGVAHRMIDHPPVRMPGPLGPEEL